MSTLWTPSGERPVEPPRPGQSGPPPAAAPTTAHRGPGDTGTGAQADEEAMAAELAAMQDQVQRTPAKVLVSNQCMGFFEIAALYLSIDPPRLADARLAIDAFAGVVDALGPRLDEAEKPMKDALAQLRLGYLEAGGSAGGGPD